MRLITLQHFKVRDTLLNKQRYTADFSRVPENLVAPYKNMQKYFGWDACPIFTVPVSTTNYDWPTRVSNEKVLLELEVPDNIAKLQYYYDWCDVIFFTEFPEDFKDHFILKEIPSLEKFAELVYNNADLNSYNVHQAVIPYIEPEWLIGYLEDIQPYLERLHTVNYIPSIMSYLSTVTVNDSMNTTSFFK